MRVLTSQVCAWKEFWGKLIDRNQGKRKAEATARNALRRLATFTMGKIAFIKLIYCLFVTNFPLTAPLNPIEKGGGSRQNNTQAKRN